MEINKSLIQEIQSIIAKAKDRAIRSVDTERALMYWQIGKAIFEEEQQGKERAEYGRFLIKSISVEFQPRMGSGFSIRQLERYRQFYRTFPITSALRTQFSWTHYKNLISIDNQDKREFYIAEASKNNWNARQLERQINSQLFERLLLSNDIKSVLAVAREEKLPTDAKEIIKDPMVLEFLGLKREATYYEKDLESAIITHLQDFILELGNGFAFVARQKRIHIEGDEFFIDLVFFNRLLQCFVVIEIKTTKLTHQDIGQLDMYVRMYDDLKKQASDNPTIGILLCTETDSTIAKYSVLDQNQQLFATKYLPYLPTEEELIAEIEREKIIIKQQLGL